MDNIYSNAFVDVSPHVHGADRLWGEMSSVGRNIHWARHA